MVGAGWPVLIIGTPIIMLTKALWRRTASPWLRSGLVLVILILALILVALAVASAIVESWTTGSVLGGP
jgi:hypothetical protein